MKHFLLLCLLLLAVYNKGNAQIILNGNFETWTSIRFNNPDHWQVTNNYSVSVPDTPATKVPGTSGYAVRLQKKQYTNPTIGNGYPFDGSGGEPYTAQPSGLDILARHDIYTGDSTRIFVYFKSSGAIIMADTFSIGSTFTSGFINYHFDFSTAFPSAPDSVIVYISSGDPFNNLPTGPGFFEIDQLSFTGVSQQLVNSGFDSWNIVSAEEPYDWAVSGRVTKSTDKYQGSFAAKLESFNESNSNQPPSIRESEVYVSPQIRTKDYVLRGYYKYMTPGIDSGRITVSMEGMASDPNIGEDVLDEFSIILAPTNTYQQFSVPLSSKHISAFDLLLIEFASSLAEPALAVEGSTLLLDGISITKATSVSQTREASNNIELFPNPVQDQLTISVKDAVAPWSVRIKDIQGRTLITEQSSNSTLRIPLHMLSNGLYFYEVRNGNQIARSQFQKQ